MIEIMALVGLTWMGIIGFLVFTASVVSDNDVTKTKAYRDLEETMLNRNEEI